MDGEIRSRLLRIEANGRDVQDFMNELKEKPDIATDVIEKKLDAIIVDQRRIFNINEKIVEHLAKMNTRLSEIENATQITVETGEEAPTDDDRVVIMIKWLLVGMTALFILGIVNLAISIN
jgi:hypothetical protein